MSDDDDSYISDVSDSISMDACSNEGNTDRQNSGMRDGLKLHAYMSFFFFHISSSVQDLSHLGHCCLVSSVVTLVRRRSTLPSPRPSSSVSLWNILRNNIGKDLSKVAMPVQLNEPINTLQRLCEELEYSELLDTANQTHDPYQRMVSEENFSCKHSPLFKMLSDAWCSVQVYVATFAISAYASTYHRAGSKPFNPVLGETYECDRPDKGFRFIAEQVQFTKYTLHSYTVYYHR